VMAGKLVVATVAGGLEVTWDDGGILLFFEHPARHQTRAKAKTPPLARRSKATKSKNFGTGQWRGLTSLANNMVRIILVIINQLYHARDGLHIVKTGDMESGRFPICCGDVIQRPTLKKLPFKARARYPTNVVF
jgi:hypothetical protein